MKKINKKLVLVVILMLSLSLNAITFAGDFTKTLKVTMGNIRLAINDVEVVPRDVNGKIVEPLLYQGTTYVPVRFVAQNFDKKISWDSSQMTVHIDDDDYISQNFEEDKKVDKDNNTWKVFVSEVKKNIRAYMHEKTVFVNLEDVKKVKNIFSIDYSNKIVYKGSYPTSSKIDKNYWQLFIDQDEYVASAFKTNGYFISIDSNGSLVAPVDVVAYLTKMNRYVDINNKEVYFK